MPVVSATATRALPSGASFDATLPDVDALAYDLRLSVDLAAPGRETFTASVLGTFVATRAGLDALDLDFEGNEVRRVEIDGAEAAYRRSGAVLTVTLPHPRPAGARVAVRVTYDGALYQADRGDPEDFVGYGGLMVRHEQGHAIVATLSWPTKARRWLPVRDHPRDGATFAVTAVVPSRYTVAANGALVSATPPAADGTRSWRYEASSPMPPYDFHVAAYDDWKEHRVPRAASGDPRSVDAFVYARDEARLGGASAVDALFGDVPAALDFYARTFGAWRWGPALRYVEEPIFGGGMEHATAVSLDETLFAGDARSARTVAFHELAHHWAGNLVRIGSWNDFWLSEGFAEYLARRFRAQAEGPAAARRSWNEVRARAIAAESSHAHPLRPADPERDVLSIFDGVVYDKGAFVMRLLAHQIGEERFTGFLRTWFERHAFGHVTTADFERELGAAAGVDVAPLFDAWVYGQGHAELAASWRRVDPGHVEVTIEQRQRGGPPAGYPGTIDVELDGSHRVRVPLTGRRSAATTPLSRDPAALVVDPDVAMYATFP